MNQPIKVLIVDDEASQRSGLAGHGFRVGHDRPRRPATATRRSQNLPIFPPTSSSPISICRDWTASASCNGCGIRGDMPPAIVLTAYGNIETAVKTVHELGAYWFLEKPIQPGAWKCCFAAPAATPDCGRKTQTWSGN